MIFQHDLDEILEFNAINLCKYLIVAFIYDIYVERDQLGKVNEICITIFEELLKSAYEILIKVTYHTRFDCQLDTLHKEYSTVDKLFMLEIGNKLNGNYQLLGRQRRCKAGQSRPSFLLPAAAVAALSG
ncbi:hypothetical protein T4D_9726 [Trichinella pseudospiralis]|uniref:Uncharacterized protein n=1 Tax=Trichinella pseudospiralis TaxID=6337 RepID=A0A0V1FK24_TRIPS|nr:hypothetical protein T4D_9726 [Trichinella pseudospiralis]